MLRGAEPRSTLSLSVAFPVSLVGDLVLHFNKPYTVLSTAVQLYG